jgi:hypothetical protein
MMADFLLCLSEQQEERRISFLERAWSNNDSYVPDIFLKVKKNSQKGPICFSINEIVTLSNYIEFTNLSSSAVQNWVKRELRELIGPPQLGKKYTVAQAATLLIVEDLQATLDFHSIQRVLRLIFNNPADHTDDIIDPVHFYAGYASIFEKLHHEKIMLVKNKVLLHQEIEQFILQEAQLVVQTHSSLNEQEAKIIQNMIITAVHAVISAYYQDLTKKNLMTMLEDNFKV